MQSQAKKMIRKQGFKETEIGRIPVEWELLTIEESTESIIDYRGKTPKKTCFGIPLITAKIVKNGRIAEPNEFIAENDYNTWMRRGIPKSGDVIITTEAPLGEVAQLNDRKIALAQRLIALRGKKGLLSNNFLRFVLQSPLVQNELRKRESGTTVVGIKQEELRKVLLPIPPYAEQEKISKILVCLDDKIELNRQMNATLEQIGQAIFKHWFVDFEFPNGDGKPYRSSGGEMVDSELGEVPEGWEVGCLGDIAENPRRAVKPSEISTNTAYIGLEHMPRKSIALGEWGCVGDVTSGKFRFQSEELLFGKLRPYFHKVGIAAIDGVCSTDILVIVPTHPSWFGFVLGHMSSDELIQYTDTISTGTKMPRANWKDLAQYEIIVPIVNVAEAFNIKINLITGIIVSNIHQSRALAAIRDALLPKLMSGELRVLATGKLPEVIE